MCVCIKVSEPKLYPLFPAVLTGLAGDSGSDISCLASVPVSCGPALPGTCRHTPGHQPWSLHIHTLQLYYNYNHSPSLLGMIWCVVLRWPMCLQARDVSVVRVTAGRAVEAGTVAEADVIWSQYRRWRPAANMAVTREQTGKGSSWGHHSIYT